MTINSESSFLYLMSASYSSTGQRSLNRFSPQMAHLPKASDTITVSHLSLLLGNIMATLFHLETCRHSVSDLASLLSRMK